MTQVDPRVVFSQHEIGGRAGVAAMRMTRKMLLQNVLALFFLTRSVGLEAGVLQLAPAISTTARQLSVCTTWRRDLRRDTVVCFFFVGTNDMTEYENRAHNGLVVERHDTTHSGAHVRRRGTELWLLSNSFNFSLKTIPRGREPRHFTLVSHRI